MPEYKDGVPRTWAPLLLAAMLSIMLIVAAGAGLAHALYHYPGQQPPEPGEAGEVNVEVTVVLNEFYIEPNAIWIPEPGATVRLIVVNEGRVVHALTVKGVGSTGIISPGGEATLEFTVEESMVLEIWCPVGDHRQRGMEGVLVVGVPQPQTVTVERSVTVTQVTTTTETVTTTSTITSETTLTETETETVTETNVAATAAAAIVALVVGIAVGLIARSLR